MRGLYVHIPFCVRKCSYCDFYSLPGRTNTIESYVQAVLKEAEFNTKGDSNFPSFVRPEVPYISTGRAHPSNGKIEGDLFPLLNPSQSLPSCLRDLRAFTKGRNSALSFQTLYVGGGTPSLLGSKNLTTLITGLPYHSERNEESSSLNRHCELSAGNLASQCHPERSEWISGWGDPLLGLTESTIELNPESTTPEFLQAVKNLGFNRLSFGVQSLNDNELQSAGRIHTAKQAIAAIKLAQKLNFKAISADLIIGLPGQTWTSLHKSLQTLVDLGIQHLSVYCLSLEEGTPLGNNPPPDLPTDDLQATLFEKTRNYLKTCGFAHYEISNFALPGYECLHNLNYWRGGEYLGLGPAAASHLNGKRFKNRANLDAYLENPTGQIEDIEELSAKDKAAEEAMLRLRLLEEGLDAKVLIARFGRENAQDIFTRLDKMVQEGLLIHEGRRYRLTPSRILTSNPIFMRVLGD